MRESHLAPSYVGAVCGGRGMHYACTACSLYLYGHRAYITSARPQQRHSPPSVPPCGRCGTLAASRSPTSLSATGISASFLSLVENRTQRHHDRPPRAPDRLLRHLDHRPAAVRGRSDYPEVIRPGERRSLQSPVEGIDIYLLTADTDRQMMPLEVHFQPGASLAEPGRHAGEEWLLVLEGELRLELEGAEPRVLGAGRHGVLPGRAAAPACRTRARARPLRVLCVDTPPTM